MLPNRSSGRTFKTNHGSLSLDATAQARAARSHLSLASLVRTRTRSGLGVHDQTPANVAAITDQRNRNFTLLLNTYDEVRRAVTFIRWKEDRKTHRAVALLRARQQQPTQKGTRSTARVPSLSPRVADESHFATRGAREGRINRTGCLRVRSRPRACRSMRYESPDDRSHR